MTRRLWYPFRPVVWRALGFLGAGLVTTTLGWAVAAVTLIVGPLLALTVVGVHALPVLLWLVRACASVERRRVGWFRREDVRPTYLPTGPGGSAPVRARIADPATWRDLGWLLSAAPVNTVAAVVSASLWAAGLGLLTLPVWYRYLPGGQAKLYDAGAVAYGVVDSAARALPWAGVGLLLVVAAGCGTRWGAALEARMGAGLLGPSPAGRLRQRIQVLSETRTAVVDDQRRQLRRIEQDLHDGAQARLVALGVDLGLAAETPDPDQARQLTLRARDELEVALAELRDLVRGIGPPILADRGLPAALESLAALCTIPVELQGSFAVRLPAAVESAAYFVVCEALANAVKHSRAGRIRVVAEVGRGRCRLEVCDDGVGGADPEGHGLAGLADRVAALDGAFTVESPAGGPTVVRAELPCGW